MYSNDDEVICLDDDDDDDNDNNNNGNVVQVNNNGGQISVNPLNKWVNNIINNKTTKNHQKIQRANKYNSKRLCRLR